MPLFRISPLQENRLYDTLLSIETVAGVLVLKVGNEVDIANADTLERYMTEASSNASELVVSLATCRYIDSSGLRPIIRLAERLGDGFAIVVPPGTHVRRIFDLTRLHEQMNVCDSLENALHGVAVRKAIR